MQKDMRRGGKAETTREGVPGQGNRSLSVIPSHHQLQPDRHHQLLPDRHHVLLPDRLLK